MEIKDRMRLLLQKAGQGIYEKEQLLALSLLASVAGESMFLLGPPGTAKSMIARRLKEMFKEKKCFEYLMSRFSTPDEIFGPVSIRKLKDEDCYMRSTDGFLPWATVVFLDEIWKAGPAIQNALLTVLNEKIYQNGRETLQLPLCGIIAASNELPAEGQGLEALWDRFLIRAVSNCIANENMFYTMLTSIEMHKPEVPQELLLDRVELNNWRQEINEIRVDAATLQAISFIRRRLKDLSAQANAKPLDYYVSDRRWRKVVNVLRSSAFLNGREEVDASDLMLLVHMLWNSDTCIPQILDAVSHAIFADISDECERMDAVTKDIVNDLASQPKQKTADDFKVVNFLYYIIEDYQGESILFPRSDYKLATQKDDIRGIMYYDKGLGSRILRRIDASNFYGQRSKRTDAESVSFRRTKTGLIINGLAYSFACERPMPNGPGVKLECSQLEEMLDRLRELSTAMRQRIEQISQSENIFLSQQDKSLALGSVEDLKEKIDELEIRISGGLLL